MHIWVIKDGEVLPLDAANSRMRTGMLAAELCRRGHTVTWWASTFSHQTKQRLFERDTVIRVNPRLQLRLLHGGAYHRNLSLRRVVHHRIVGRRFARTARAVPPPDVVVAALPTIDLAYQAGRYTRTSAVPLIVDVRDPWPDSLVDMCPTPLQGMVRRLLAPEYRRAAAALSSAAALAAVTPGCLEWALDLIGRPKSADDAVFFTAAQAPTPAAGDPSPYIKNLVACLRGKVIFAYVGTFGHSYQLALVADVAADLDRRGIDTAHFVLAGHGHQFNDLARRAARMRNLTVTGWLNRPDLAYVLAAASVGLVPTVSVPQALGNKVFEYMAAGLPLLTSQQGETGDLVSRHHIGRLYTAGDAESLRARVLDMVYDAAERERMGARSRRLFDEHFRADRIYSAYADLVERIASVNAPPASAAIA